MIHRLKKAAVFVVCVALTICLPTFAMAAELEKAPDNNQVTGDASSSVTGDGIEAVSIGAEVISGDNNVVIGFSNQNIQGGNESNNKGSISVQATNSNSDLRVGYGAISGYGDNNTIVGSNAWAGGFSPESPSHNNVAIGNSAIAYGGNSVAIGLNAEAPYTNSVALGAGSITDRDNSVSVGGRQITNVAPGTYGTDAVNMSQLWAVDNKVDRVGSMAFAMSALVPLPYDPKDPTQYSAGIGTYNGQGAVALGVFHYTKPTMMYNAAIAMSDDGWEKSARVGVTWRTGGSKPKVITPAVAEKNVQQDEGTIISRVNKILTDNK